MTDALWTACNRDGHDAGAGDLIAWSEAVPRLSNSAAGRRCVVAWVTAEEARGAVLVLQVISSDGCQAYLPRTVLRRQRAALQRRGIRRQERLAECAEATANKQFELQL